VALPIFQPIVEAIWAEHIAPKMPLAGPSPEAKRELVDIPIDYMSGNRVGGNANNGGNGFWSGFGNTANNPPPSGGAFVEHFKRGADGQVADTQYQLVNQADAYASTNQGQSDDDGQNWFFGAFSNGGNRGGGQWMGRSYYPNQSWQGQPQAQAPQQQQRGFFQFWNWGDNNPPPPPPPRGQTYQRSQNYYGGRTN
jgi:hypothetical protein